MNTPGGSIYSADHTLERFRPENLVKSRPETAIPYLTLVKFHLKMHVLISFKGGQDILTFGVASTMLLPKVKKERTKFHHSGTDHKFLEYLWCQRIFKFYDPGISHEKVELG